MHIGEIRTRRPLDLATPLDALSTSMLLARLKSNVYALRKSISVIAPIISAETKSDLSRAWRIDTRATDQDHNVNTISHWIQNLQEVNASVLASPRASSLSAPASPSTRSTTLFESTVDFQREHEASSGLCEDYASTTSSKAPCQVYVPSSLVFANAH